VVLVDATTGYKTSFHKNSILYPLMREGFELAMHPHNMNRDKD
jgi:hypothetical protein